MCAIGCMSKTTVAASPHASTKANQARYIISVQEKHGVKYQRYWYDEGTGMVFCLVEAPSKEAAAAVHSEAHGFMADEIIEVKEGS